MIRIHALEVRACIGITAAERETAQRLLLDIAISTRLAFGEMHDAIDATVDYAAVAAMAQRVAASRERNLIETLAVDLAHGILEGFARAEAVDVRVKKFVIPEAEAVSVAFHARRGELTA